MRNPANTAYLHHVETQYFASLQQKKRFRPFLNSNWRKFKQFLIFKQKNSAGDKLSPAEFLNKNRLNNVWITMI